MRNRQTLIKEWIGQLLGSQEYELELAAGDASARRYWRIRLEDHSYVLMDAPPVAPDIARFAELSERFRSLGLNTPKIFAQAPEQGLILMSDMGTRLYLDFLNEESADRLYGDALSALAVLQTCGPTAGLPAYDNVLLNAEMALFPQWLVVEHLGLPLSDADRHMLEKAFGFLTASALEQPQVCVHRDYHSRNLMVTDPPSPGILDFQDALLGPVTYDLVSLLRDCYIAWPQHQVEKWARGYAALAVQSGILRQSEEDRFMVWFDLMGVQRHLKACGIFARLNIRDSKPGYLAHIPRTLAYVLNVARDYPELGEVAALIRDLILPKLSASHGKRATASKRNY